MARKKTDKKARPKRRAPKRSWLSRAIRAVIGAVFGLIWRLAFRTGVLVALVLALATGYFFTQLPPADELLDGRAKGSVTLLDRHGDVFAWRGDQYGGALRVGEMSPHLSAAVVATEDKRFYSHFGVDPRGLARAMAENIRAGRLVQGGSTLTQQTAKNVFLSNERSIQRKLKELPMALAMEIKYSKNEILSIYMNRVYLGAGAYGFEAAAKRYFGKSAREVTASEAAMLAGLLKAPSRFSPTSDLSRAQGRADLVLGLMADQGYLTPDQLTRARARPARLSSAAAAKAGGYFADWIMEAGPDYLTEATSEDVRIKSTFDPAVQRAAEQALVEVFATRVKDGSNAQAAIVVMSHDGAVRAMVGGRDIGEAAGQFNRATQAKRQTGSAFKPVVYAAGLESGLSPNDVIEDRPLTIKKWSPKNYGGGFRGHVTLTEALAQSINTVAVRVSEHAGRDKVAEMARRLGMVSPIAPGPAVALGTSEATLLEMTGVFASIASGGLSATPYGMEEISLQGEAASLMASAGRPAASRALDERTATLLTGMMRQVVENGTGRRARLDRREAAGKTGTTQAARDAWFIGFTADYVAGVWMGYDDNSPLTGVTGGGLPAEIWRDTMLRAHVGLPPRPLNITEPEQRLRTVISDFTDPVAETIFRDVMSLFTSRERRRDDGRVAARAYRKPEDADR